MNIDDIIRMAREAGFRVGPSRDGPDDVWGVGSTLVRFAALVATAEREACAQEADAHASIEGVAQRIAAAIRARGER